MNIPLICKNGFRSTVLIGSIVGMVAVGTVNAVACDKEKPQAHSDGIGATLSDTAITGKVKAKLMGKEGLDQSNIHVTTTNGVVTLKGSASNSDAKDLAEEKAKTVAGVKSVDNELRTPDSSNAMHKTKRVVSDSWITTKVKSELLADSLTKGFDVSVETINGVVVLKGDLANEAAIQHVKSLAEKVDGVKGVDASGLTVENQ